MINASLNIKKEFLRALYDDEGSVKSKYQLALYSINKSELEQIKVMLEEFKLNSKIVSGFGCKRNVYGLMIRDFRLFSDKIGFNLRRKQDKLNQFCKDIWYSSLRKKMLIIS